MLTGFSVPGYVVFTSLSYLGVLLNDLPGKRERTKVGHYLPLPLPVKRKNLVRFFNPPFRASPVCTGGENCSLSFPFSSTPPPFLSLFSRARIPRVNHGTTGCGDFVNLQPPRVSARWPFTGQPDSNEECLKVGDLYGLRAILFRVGAAVGI